MGSVFEHRYATQPSVIVNEPTELFIKSLKQVHTEKVVDEEEQPLISPAVFDPDLSPETDVGIDHVLCASGVWLDVEDGHLTHRDLATIFPFLRMVAFNSFRSTKARPRFTVYIPTSRLLTREEYRVITGQVLQTVKDAGFRLRTRNEDHKTRKAHGIDLGKMHAASLFCVPCQPRDPTGRIWKDHRGPDRHPLDVDDWLQFAIAVEADERAPVELE